MRNLRDLQSLGYLLLLPALVIWQWCNGFNWLLYLLELFLTLGIGVIHHNHTHLRIWHNPRLNRLTDIWICLLQGHPGFVFFPAHIANHHRYRHGEQDVARTYRFTTPGASGDTNHLVGYLLHPLQAIWVLYPLFVQYLCRRHRYNRRYFYYCLFQYALVIGLWCCLALMDWQKCLALVLIPQLHGLHWLLATNYLQHAHADGHSKGLNYARNFYGLLNPLLFNIGYHTAHHEHPRAHWSQLPRLHQLYKNNIAPALHEPSLPAYMLRVFVLGLFVRRWRSRSLMAFTHKD